MKKIISMGVASAICALTAISASAATAATPASFVLKSGEMKKDSVIVVDVMAGQDTTGLSFKVNVEGLEALKAEDVTFKTNAMIKQYDPETKTVMISAGTGKVVAKAGEVLCTITAKVTAEAGKDVKISLVDNSGKYTQFLPDEEFKQTVLPADGTSTPAPGTSTPAPGTSTPGTSTPSTPGTNPPTGVALAVVPAVLAAAGVVVAKKRK